MTQKGVYPHEYTDSFQRFQELQLPPENTFYSSLTGEDIPETIPIPKGYVLYVCVYYTIIKNV